MTLQPFAWQWRTLQDALNPRDPVKWAVTNLLAIPSLSIVYGAPGSFKSMLLADLCACVAAGLPWLEPTPGTGGPAGLSTTAGPVCWLDFDNGTRRTDDRMEAIARARKLDATIPLHYVSMPAGGLCMDEQDQAEMLALTLMDKGARLAVIDNLGVISGRADENTGQMTKVMGNLRFVAEMANVALVVVHHQRKSNGASGRKGETLRGHSSIEAALDLALLVERDDGSQEVKLRGTKVRGANVSERDALFSYKHKPGTHDLAEARFWGWASPQSTTNKDIEDAIVSALQAGPLNQTAILKAVKAQDATVKDWRIREALDNLCLVGAINSKPGKKPNELIYHV